ncbi:MAG: class I SAM-dependent methyltransferase [Eubacteriales bacterium]|nr:class I SAM-dependent methyltransferase [Eubacteriales bacterium]
MQLSRRLSAIAQLVPEGRCIADVGCDHGYLPVFLVMEGKIPGAIAMDVRKGPLERARGHILQYGLEQYIETRLSDGLDALKEGEADVLVIAGMGGPLMEQILERGAGVRDSFSELILQPQSDIGHFRHYLGERGYRITSERAVLEDGKFYFLMKASKGSMQDWTEAEYAYGGLLLRERNPILREYLLKERGVKEKLVERLEKTGGSAAARRLKEIKEEMQTIEAALEYYEMQ